MQESYINARHGDDGNVPAFQNSPSASPVAGESRLVTPMRQQVVLNVHPAMRINSEEEHLRLKDEFASPHGADPRPIDDSPALIAASPSGSNRTPITLTFKDLGYSVQLSKAHMPEEAVKNKVKVSNRREILKGLTGICRPGELTAIMGSSGAGKTTLLNILSVRTTTKGNNVLSGEFLANKQAYDFGKFNKFAGYVMQNDILLETMTPREIFQFVADLRLNISKEERVKKVNQLLADLKLNRAADTFVGGGFLKGISGGERKRTSIGVELMTDPNLLFLDEPTSGLDSFTAFLLITLLKNLAVRNNKTVIFTIHQPSSDTFFLFDKLMLLAKGKFIYQGPTSHAVDYFKAIGYQCPEYTNPADYFIEVAHSNGNDDSKYEKMYASYDTQLAPAIAQEVDSNPSGKIALAQKTIKPFEAFSYIAKRSFKHMLRNPLLLKGRFGQTIFVTFLICCVYFKIGSTVNNDGQGHTGNQTAESIQSQIIRNTNGGLFFFVISIFMTNAMTIILTFPAERAIFLREYSSNMYSVSAYYFGKSSVEVPFIIFFPIIMSAISYYIIGFNSGADNFFIFMLINILVALAGNATGLWLGSLFNDPKVATNVLPAFLIPFMLFAGFYINVGTIHHWIRWVQWLSPFRYALEAMMWNQYQGSEYGTAQIAIYHYDLGLWQAIGTLFGLGLGIRLLALLSLKLLVRKLE